MSPGMFLRVKVVGKGILRLKRLESMMVPLVAMSNVNGDLGSEFGGSELICLRTLTLSGGLPHDRHDLLRRCVKLTKCRLGDGTHLI